MRTKWPGMAYIHLRFSEPQVAAFGLATGNATEPVLVGPGQKHARSDNNLTAQATELWCPRTLSFASRDAVTDFNSSRRIFELSADEMS